MEFREGRRSMVEALKRMAVWKELFQDAALLLLALAEAETESWANNASGEFANLFSVGPGPLAPTEASPSGRFPVLRRSLLSDSPERKQLGIQACARALSAGYFHRVIGAEYQGVRREPDLWRPETYGDMFDAYRSTWDLMNESLGYLDSEEKAQAVKVLLSNARGLTRLEPLADMVIETIRDLATDPEVDRRDLIGRTVEILHYEGKSMGAETKGKWERLAEELSGEDFSSRMERYVAMELLEDEFDEDGQHVNQAQPHIEELASLAVETPQLLLAELNWLVTKRANAGHRFGYELGKRDLDKVFLEPILDAQTAAEDDANLSFIGSYFRALSEREPDEWESLLDTFAQCPGRAGWVVEGDLAFGKRQPTSFAAGSPTDAGGCHRSFRIANVQVWCSSRVTYSRRLLCLGGRASGGG